GISQIYVARLEGGRFRPVGGSLNLSPDDDASDPDIAFVGNVPHVTWSEMLDGVRHIYVSHLADSTPGAERWDIDSLDTGLNRQPAPDAPHPAISPNGVPPLVAWEEGDTPANVFAAIRSPIGPAWGRNYPPFIRIISGTRFLAVSQTSLDHTLPAHSQ